MIVEGNEGGAKAAPRLTAPNDRRRKPVRSMADRTGPEPGARPLKFLVTPRWPKDHGQITARKQLKKRPAAIRKWVRRAAAWIKRRGERQILWLFRRLAPSADLADARRFAAGYTINT